jgi:hypothetical protein
MKVEYIKYKCFKCAKLFPFEEMTEVPQKFENGSTKITYICKECKDHD